MTAIKIPAHIQPYIETLGEELGVKFLLSFGGSYVHISERPQERSPVVALIGHDKTVALAKRLMTGSFRVPTAKPFIAQVFRGKGWTVNMIARELHVTDVSVRGWLKPDLGRQLQLL